jgi:ABC-type transport system substrate-binding protein
MVLEVGDIDFCEVQAPDYTRYLKTGGDGFEVEMSPDGTTVYFAFSLHPGDGADYWQDRRLREAVAVGVNWDDVGQLAMGDMYIKAYSVATADSPDFINPGQYEYNPEKAKALLAEAGYGPDHPLSIYTSTMDNPMNKNGYEALLFYLSAIGIDAKVDFKDVSAALGDWLNPGNTDYGFFYNETGSALREVRADIFDAYTPEGVTYTYIPDEEFLEQFQVLLRSTDPAAVSATAKWCQQWLFDYIQYIPIFELTSAVGWRTDKFTEKQVLNYRVYSDNYQLSRLGLASAWK